jgi:hypothetical protein
MTFILLAPDNKRELGAVQVLRDSDTHHVLALRFHLNHPPRVVTYSQQNLKDLLAAQDIAAIIAADALSLGGYEHAPRILTLSDTRVETL